MPDYGEMDEILREIKGREEEQGRKAAAARATLLPLLRALNISTVITKYDGQGDEGQIEDVQFHGTDGKQLLIHLDLPVASYPQHEEATKDIFYDYLEALAGGWEINEGSYGDFIWELGADRILWTHNHRIESVETTEEEL